MKRRNLFRLLGAGVASLPALGHPRLAWAGNDSLSTTAVNEQLFAKWEGRFGPSIVDDESFWRSFATDFYHVSPDYINLENGYFGVQPIPVNRAYHHFIDKVNLDSSYYMRREYWADWQAVMQSLAAFSGAAPEELLVTRNATEAMNILINGYPLKAGDEVILQHHDYHSMIEAFQMLQQRRGIRLKFLDVPLVPNDDDELVKLYESAISPVTTIILLTHLTHLTGQVLPVKKITEMAHKRGVEVMVDAAHSFAHLQYKFPELTAGMVGVNLHKWFANPLGAGLLYVKKENIERLAPFYGDVSRATTDINKLGHFGTQPGATLLTLPTAARFSDMITPAVKEARLHYLKTYWATQAAKIGRVRVHTPLQAGQSCAIGSFSIEGQAAGDTVQQLLDDYGVFTVKRVLKDREVVRVTPGLYTSSTDLDRLLEGIEKLSKK